MIDGLIVYIHGYFDHFLLNLAFWPFHDNLLLYFGWLLGRGYFNETIDIMIIAYLLWVLLLDISVREREAF